MAAIKAHQAQSYLKSPDPRVSAFLFFGSDAGLVNDASRRIIICRETYELFTFFFSGADGGQVNLAFFIGL